MSRPFSEPEEPTLRRMTLEDIDEVYRIEALCYPSPWSRESFRIEAQDHHYAICLVLALPTPGQGGRGPILAYICNWLVGDEMQVNNLAVHPDWRNRGFAERLMRVSLAEGIARGARTCYLDVRPSNSPARNLYRKLGFRDFGTRPRYYRDNDEDALVMRLVLRPPAPGST